MESNWTTGVKKFNGILFSKLNEINKVPLKITCYAVN